ncbi:MAG: (2Fe-2S)-binding protein [Chloroflexi bacterium]|nr:(2Fe-2S)-binding protein [Chloroflexota bacterium]MBI3339691.1 (2Fe-2S)-binding protein [Chloroflexota bacterium]
MILNVNGSRHEVQEGTRTLLEVLRDDLGLVGTKEGCGVGMCGACTVLVDGRPISGCLILAEQVVGKEILTVEGLEKNGQLHPIQQAFIDERAFQCAYCTPGFILSTAALLNENPNPSEDEIREYLSGNLCRCGSYQNILKAVLRAHQRV